MDRWKFENSVQPGSSSGLKRIYALFHGLAAQKASREWEEGAFGIGDTCLQQRASSRWVQQVERRVLSTAHQPPACACLPKQFARPRGTGEVGAAQAHIQAASDCPAPRCAPAPAFCSRSPQPFLPTRHPLDARSATLRFSRGPGAQKDGAHAYRGRGWWRGMCVRAAGAPLHG